MAARFLDILKAKDWFEQNKIETVDTFALPFGQASHLGEGTADLCTDFGYSTVLMLTGQPCLTNYRGKSTIIDRLLIHPEWDKKISTLPVEVSRSYGIKMNRCLIV